MEADIFLNSKSELNFSLHHAGRFCVAVIVDKMGSLKIHSFASSRGWGSTGNVIVTAVPFPILLFTEMLPLWASAMRLQMGKPKPMPFALVVNNGMPPSSLRKVSFDIPIPVSLNAISSLRARYGSSALIITHEGDILDYIKAKYGCVLLNGVFHCYTHPTRIYEEIKKVGYEECVACRVRKTEGWKFEQTK